MAGRARTKGGESCPAREGEEFSVQWPEARSRGQKSRSGAPRGGRVDRKTRAAPHQAWILLVRHSALRSPHVEGSKDRRRRARAAKNRASGALAFYPSPEWGGIRRLGCLKLWAEKTKTPERFFSPVLQSMKPLAISGGAYCCSRDLNSKCTEKNSAEKKKNGAHHEYIESQGKVQFVPPLLKACKA